MAKASRASSSSSPSSIQYSTYVIPETNPYEKGRPFVVPRFADTKVDLSALDRAKFTDQKEALTAFIRVLSDEKTGVSSSTSFNANFEVKSARLEIERLNLDKIALEDKLKEVTAIKDQFKDEVAGRVSCVQQIEAAVREKDEEIQENNRKLNELGEQIANLREEVQRFQSARGTNAEQQIVVESLQTELSQAQRKLSEKEMEYRQYKTNAEARIQKLNDDVDTYSMNLTSAKELHLDEIDSLKEERQKVQRELDQQKALNEVLVSQQTAASQEVNELNQRIVELNAVIENLNTQVSVLNAKYAEITENPDGQFQLLFFNSQGIAHAARDANVKVEYIKAFLTKASASSRKEITDFLESVFATEQISLPEPNEPESGTRGRSNVTTSKQRRSTTPIPSMPLVNAPQRAGRAKAASSIPVPTTPSSSTAYAVSVFGDLSKLNDILAYSYDILAGTKLAPYRNAFINENGDTIIERIDEETDEVKIPAEGQKCIVFLDASNADGYYAKTLKAMFDSMNPKGKTKSQKNIKAEGRLVMKMVTGNAFKQDSYFNGNDAESEDTRKRLLKIFEALKDNRYMFVMTGAVINIINTGLKAFFRTGSMILPTEYKHTVSIVTATPQLESKSNPNRKELDTFLEK